jgi:hypothetical protein
VDKDKRKKRPFITPLIEIVSVRDRPLNITDSIKELQQERTIILNRIREKDESAQGDVFRLENIARQMVYLYRAKALAEAKRKKRLAARKKKSRK